ncbi:MAG: hypothetical protein WCA35_07090 [Kovacikia sp.]
MLTPELVEALEQIERELNLHPPIGATDEDLNGFRYHDLWLRNLLIASSLNGRHTGKPVPLKALENQKYGHEGKTRNGFESVDHHQELLLAQAQGHRRKAKPEQRYYELRSSEPMFDGRKSRYLREAEMGEF